MRQLNRAELIDYSAGKSGRRSASAMPTTTCAIFSDHLVPQRESRTVSPFSYGNVSLSVAITPAARCCGPEMLGRGSVFQSTESGRQRVQWNCFKARSGFHNRTYAKCYNITINKRHSDTRLQNDTLNGRDDMFTMGVPRYDPRPNRLA